MTALQPIRYFGGKGGMIKTLMSYFPPASDYDTFVDAYGGAGTVLLNKPRAKVEIYNDLDRNVYSLFKVLADPVLFQQFQHLACLALYDETTSIDYRESLRRDELDPVQRAFKFWYVARSRRTGNGGFSINCLPRRGMSKSTSDFLASVDGLAYLHARLRPIVICNRDAIELIKHHDRPRTLIYLDPPYVQSTRSSSTRYGVDQDDAHHRALVEELDRVRHAFVVLSGYDTPIYEGLTSYIKDSFSVNSQTGTGVPKKRSEFIWRNFQATKLPMFE